MEDNRNFIEETSKNNAEVLNSEDLLIDSSNLEGIKDSMQITEEVDESAVARPQPSELRENLNFTFNPKILDFIPERKRQTNIQSSVSKIKKAKKKKKRISNQSKRKNR